MYALQAFLPRGNSYMHSKQHRLLYYLIDLLCMEEITNFDAVPTTG